VQRREPVGGPARDQLRVLRDVAAQVVRPAERGMVEPVERRLRGEQRLQRARLPVVERDPHRGDPVLVRVREPGLAREQRLDGGRVTGLDRCDQVRHGRDPTQRSSPHTRSVTSFVNAASRRKVRGTPGERSENATEPASIDTR
jgi:hypothetical protein